MQILSIESISLSIANMERSLEFYTTVLSCKKVFDHEISGAALDQLYNLPNVRLRQAQLKLGNETIELIEFLSPKGRPIPVDSRSHDRWFQHLAIAVSDMETAHQHLQQWGVTQISPSPQTLPQENPVAGGIQALYFKDLDGHNLELIHFPKGKGDPKWQGATESLMLGIDHTAIVVANTSASLAFYCDRLGMKLQQSSQNLGSEQERLSDVSEARVQVSSLSAPTGLGIELLEYQEPRDGQPIPDDTRANDQWCWQTTIAVQDIGDAAQQLQLSQPHPPSIVAVAEPQSSFDRSFLTQDPDGHRVRVVGKSTRSARD